MCSVYKVKYSFRNWGGVIEGSTMGSDVNLVSRLKRDDLKKINNNIKLITINQLTLTILKKITK